MIELGLTRVFRLLARTPLPWRAIHVAGTNGKGSICAYVSEMLSAYNRSALRMTAGRAPLKHGRYTSPHLIDRWDCITINNKTISESIFKEVEARILERNRSENIQASEFELLTATAFEIFTQERVDIGVIEVGMGGRLDATNILGQSSEYDLPGECGMSADRYRPKPLVTAISTIALDHQGFLGATLEEISTQKAGIIKPGVPVVLAPNDTSVTNNIVSIAQQVGAGQSLYAADAPGFEGLRSLNFTSGPSRDDASVRYQNGAVAFQLARSALRQEGCIVSEDTTEVQALYEEWRRIPMELVWPGRVQDISLQNLTGYKPLAVLDGAHNEESAQALANTIRKRAGTSGVTWVIAASQGKDIATMLEILLRGHGGANNVVATKFGSVDGMPWVKAMSPETIVEAVPQFEPKPETVVAVPDLQAALRSASSLASETGSLLVIAGSLYLAGDVSRMLRNGA